MKVSREHKRHKGFYSKGKAEHFKRDLDRCNRESGIKSENYIVPGRNKTYIVVEVHTWEA